MRLPVLRATYRDIVSDPVADRTRHVAEEKKLHSRDTSVCSIKLVTLKGGGIRNINKKEKSVWFCLHLMDVEKSVSVLCCLKAFAMLGIVQLPKEIL